MKHFTYSDVCFVIITGMEDKLEMDRGFFRKVDVPDHAHYIVAFFVAVIGALGVTGNILVIYAFFRWAETLYQYLVILLQFISDCFTEAVVSFTVI